VALGVPLICLYLFLMSVALGFPILGGSLFIACFVGALATGFFNPRALLSVAMGRTVWFIEGRLHWSPVIGRGAFSAERQDVTAFVANGERFIDVHLVEGPTRRIDCGHLTVERDALIAELRALRAPAPLGAGAIAS
jgi:hypothetical protein